ncbi:mannose/fructose/sorbose PTS transporter subunit IIB [Enterococcus villorum]|uniref:PTS fructose transporter subunit IIB n=2 Tax=Enterococcus villorum TaxID=112904 RepID=A0A511IZM4_9ENTE|nr:mannose/fructose/sorbose PTS transporter subunit IIB [Enterococcus villorum]EOH89324.1 PTS system, mannose/fructose/sorbose family, IIB component [Enterococcus villorum ATCC 700913]EOW76132.1 PTS system mannose/fructose/sorbose-specific IIB component [Enterococcus villorum ATCC 700913]GEL91185.1 PTS fructose transporter subunit IIB [Enterococcus villorum]
MDIRLARIDDRLIHGQVATVWSKLTGVERIIVISDLVAQDKLRKFLLKEAAPPGITANVITVNKMIQVYQSGLLEKTKVMLLFTNPQDVEKLVLSGVQLNSLNIGGMSFSEGKTMITNFVSVDQNDIDSFHFLNQQGVELEIRKVPADRKILLMELLAKTKKA